MGPDWFNKLYILIVGIGIKRLLLKLPAFWAPLVCCTLDTYPSVTDTVTTPIIS